MIDYLRAVKCPKLEDVLKKFDTVEKRAKISLNNYLGKQPLTSPLQTITDSIYKYYGEVNADGKAHGRGIQIYNSGSICIDYWKNGRWIPGNYIDIESYGDEFELGEYYIKDGKLWVRGYKYYFNGTERPYDREKWWVITLNK